VSVAVAFVVSGIRLPSTIGMATLLNTYNQLSV
jgi:hypothetical protein